MQHTLRQVEQMWTDDHQDISIPMKWSSSCSSLQAALRQTPTWQNAFDNIDVASLITSPVSPSTVAQLYQYHQHPQQLTNFSNDCVSDASGFRAIPQLPPHPPPTTKTADLSTRDLPRRADVIVDQSQYTYNSCNEPTEAMSTVLPDVVSAGMISSTGDADQCRIKLPPVYDDVISGSVNGRRHTFELSIGFQVLTRSKNRLLKRTNESGYFLVLGFLDVFAIHTAYIIAVIHPLFGNEPITDPFNCHFHQLEELKLEKNKTNV